VALQAAGSVAVVNLRQGKVEIEIPVGRGPSDVALHGRRLFVSCEDDDQLVEVDPERRAVARRWPTAQAPRGLAIHPDGTRVFVACHDAKTVQAIDPASAATTALALDAWAERVVIHRDTQAPYLLILSANERGATVTMSAVDRLRVLSTNRIAGISNAPGFASKPGPSSFVLLVHQQPRDKVPATQVAQGWVFTNAISSFSPWGIDTPKGGASPAKVLDEPGRAFADPSDVALSPDHRHAFVACGGADSVLVLRSDRFVSANYGPMDADASHHNGKDDLSLTRRYLVARIPTQANPRRLALSGDGGTLVVSNTLADSLTVIDARTFEVRRHIALGTAEVDAARRGERLFHSNRLTFQGQFTCASCHPHGGSDGLNWDLSRDGIGNFLNTRSLRGIADTAPYGWHGTSATLPDRIAGTLRQVHRVEPTSTEVDDLAAYLRTLPPPRPLPVPAAERDAVARGNLLFHGKAKCSACHQEKTWQDGIAHDVGTKIDGDLADRFDTPSLRGLVRTAPYLHHGQAATLDDVFSKFNERQRHGAAHLLTPAELTELIAFLRSL
jgi:cytochrome c peroxidase